MSLNLNNSNNIDLNTFPNAPNDTPSKSARRAFSPTANLNGVDLLTKLHRENTSTSNFSGYEDHSSDILYKTALSGILDSDTLSRVSTAEPPTSPLFTTATAHHRPSTLDARASPEVSATLCDTAFGTKSTTEVSLSEADKENICRSSGETFVVGQCEKPSPVAITPLSDRPLSSDVFGSSNASTPVPDFINENLQTELNAARNRAKALEAELEFYKTEVVRLMSENDDLRSQIPKKSVTFNAKSLTPEIIDSKLPAGTPVRRGRRPEGVNGLEGTPVRSVSSSAGSALRNSLLKKATVSANLPNRQRGIAVEQSTPMFNDSLTAECEEASAAILQLKQKFSERAKMTSPEVLKSDGTVASVGAGGLAHNTSSSSASNATPQKVLKSMERLQQQLSDVRLDQTPLRGEARESETVTRSITPTELRERVMASLKTCSGTLQGSSTDPDILEISPAKPRGQRTLIPEAMASTIDQLKKEEKSLCLGSTDSDIMKHTTPEKNATPEKVTSPVSIKTESLQVLGNLSPPQAISIDVAAKMDKSMDFAAEVVQKNEESDENLPSNPEMEKSPKRLSVTTMRCTSPLITTSISPKSATQSLAVEPPLEGCKSPKPRAVSETETARTKRLSIANQSSHDKVLLEKRRKAFIEKQEEKRRAALDKKREAKEVEDIQAMDAESPVVMRAARPRTGPGRSNSTSVASVSRMDKSAVIQQRRERAKAMHDKEKQRLDYTLNPPPSSSRSALQSASSSRLSTLKKNPSITKPKTAQNTGHDNKSQVILAIEKTCLPGAVNAKDRKLVIEPIHTKLATKETSHLVVLFRNDRLQFRGVYRLETPKAEEDQENQATDALKVIAFEKISGQGPLKVQPGDIKSYFSYQTGRKIFSPINGKTFGYNVVGMTVDERIWAKTRPKKTEIKQK